MATISFVMQKKGGVGKSVCASLYYQALAEAGRSVIGVDTDPSNKSLKAYKSLNIIALDILGKEQDVDKSMFDALLDAVDKVPEDAHVIVDSGASSYPSLRAYLLATKALEALKSLGHTVLIHVVVVGGTEQDHTLECLRELASEDFTDSNFVVWLNTNFGDIVHKSKGFEDFSIVTELGSQLFSVVKIPECCQNSMWRKDLQAHFTKCHTFQEGITSPENHIMTRQRLKMFWEETKSAMSAARLL